MHRFRQATSLRWPRLGLVARCSSLIMSLSLSLLNCCRCRRQPLTRQVRMSTKSKYGEITLRNEFLPIREPQRNFVNIGKFRRNEIPLKAAKPPPPSGRRKHLHLHSALRFSVFGLVLRLCAYLLHPNRSFIDIYPSYSVL